MSVGLCGFCRKFVENCRNPCKVSENGKDVACYHLCIRIFIEYKKNGILPEKCVYMI